MIKKEIYNNEDLNGKEKKGVINFGTLILMTCLTEKTFSLKVMTTINPNQFPLTQKDYTVTIDALFFSTPLW